MTHIKKIDFWRKDELPFLTRRKLQISRSVTKDLMVRQPRMRFIWHFLLLFSVIPLYFLPLLHLLLSLMKLFSLPHSQLFFWVVSPPARVVVERNNNNAWRVGEFTSLHQLSHKELSGMNCFRCIGCLVQCVSSQPEFNRQNVSLIFQVLKTFFQKNSFSTFQSSFHFKK